MSKERKPNGEPSPKKGKKVGDRPVGDKPVGDKPVGDQPVFPSSSRGSFSTGSIGSAGSSGYGASIGSAATPRHVGSAATPGFTSTPGYAGSVAATPGYAGSAAATPGYAESLDATPSAGSSGSAMDLDEEPETPIDSPGIMNQLDPRLAPEQIELSHATSSSNSLPLSNSSSDITSKPKSPLSDVLQDSRIIGETLLKKVIMNFNLSSNQSTVDLDFIAELVSFHKGHQTMSRQRFCNHLRALATQLNHLGNNLKYSMYSLYCFCCISKLFSI